MSDKQSNLGAVAVGDTLIVEPPGTRRAAYIVTVEKATPARITGDGEQYDRRDGRRSVDTGAEAERRERERAAEREAMRGRSVGYLHAALDALPAADDNPVTAWLRQRLFSLRLDLESAEREVGRALETLRSLAADLERAVASDYNGDAVRGYMSGDDYRAAEDRRVLLREQVQPLIELAAIVLGIDYEQVVAPMMKTEGDGTEPS